jgi:DNA/RNA endonuclease YhcR with UshA esterase domain
LRRTIRLALGIGLLLLGTALAQNNQPSHENYQYDAARQVIVRGTVQEVRNYQCPVSGTVGAHITLKQDFGSIEVHLAPATFLKQYEIEIKKGDQVEIQGVKIQFEGKPALLARVVADDNVMYQFRDSNGKPLW